MMKASPFVCMVSVVLVGLTPIYAAPSQAQKVSRAKSGVGWHPDPAFENALGAETRIGGYEMRLPNGYRRIHVPNAEAARGFDTYMFSHDRLPDGTAPDFAVTIATPPPGMTGFLSLGQALAGIIAQKRQAMSGFTDGPVERGKIGSMTFVRCHFQGTVTGRIGTRTVHGLAYAALDGRKIIAIQAEDTAAHSLTTIPVVEAGILTFRKQ